MVNFLSLFYKKIFAKKTLILISKGKIRNYEIGSLFQVFILIFAILVADSFYKSANYNDLIKDKAIKISELQKANKKFQKELDSINNNLETINEYFANSEGYESELDAKNESGLHDEKFDELFSDLDLGKSYKKTASKIIDAHIIMENIKNFAKKRISALESKIATTGISLSENKISSKGNADDMITISLNSPEEILKQGGPFEKSKNINKQSDQYLKIASASGDVNGEIMHLADVEKFMYHAPLMKPMKDYYVSSGFGARIDPIRKDSALHYGMDFVGEENAEVVSPSLGEVKAAGTLGAYGKMVIIDHGYGITTRYGHLHEIKVKKGDIVTRGQLIGIQGSTGRSTGPHLHYEIRYNDMPLNPKNFLQSGENVFGRNGA